MKNLFKPIFLPLLVCLLLTTTALHVDEQVVIDSDEKAKEIFLGHYWKCKWKNENYSWNSERMYQKVRLKKQRQKLGMTFARMG